MDDKETLIWVEPNGTQHVLTNQEDISVTVGPSGRYMPNIEYTEEETPYQSGSRPRHVKVKAREMDFPVEINGQTMMDIKNKLRQLLRIFNPLKGDGTMISVSPDGSQREIKCRYIGGLQIKESGRI